MYVILLILMGWGGVRCSGMGRCRGDGVRGDGECNQGRFCGDFI